MINCKFSSFFEILAKNIIKNHSTYSASGQQGHQFCKIYLFFRNILDKSRLKIIWVNVYCKYSCRSRVETKGKIHHVSQNGLRCTLSWVYCFLFVDARAEGSINISKSSWNDFLGGREALKLKVTCRWNIETLSLKLLSDYLVLIIASISPVSCSDLHCSYCYCFIFSLRYFLKIFNVAY